MATHPLCVLVAEDDSVSQTLLSHLLESLGHSVIVAEHGAQALELAATRDLDVVLMDMQMPVIDGETATRLIRMLPGGRARLPVVALTADDSAASRDRYQDAGLNAILIKPITADRLAEALRQVTSKHAATGQATIPAAANAPTHPVLDPAYLEDMRQWVGDATVMALLSTAPQSFRDELAEITDAWQAGNLNKVRENAHRLKGAAGSVGCRRLSNTAQIIQRGEDTDLANRLLLERLRADVDDAIAATSMWQPAV